MNLRLESETLRRPQAEPQNSTRFFPQSSTKLSKENYENSVSIEISNLED